MPLKGWRLTTLAEPVQMSTDFTNRQKNIKPAPNRNGLSKDPRYVIKTSRIYQSQHLISLRFRLKSITGKEDSAGVQPQFIFVT